MPLAVYSETGPPSSLEHLPPPKISIETTSSSRGFSEKEERREIAHVTRFADDVDLQIENASRRQSSFEGGRRQSRASETADINLMSECTDTDERRVVLQLTDVYDSDGDFSTDTHEEFRSVNLAVNAEQTSSKRKKVMEDKNGGWASYIVKSCRDWATSLCRLSAFSSS